jgi:hypothetical protein
MIYQVFKQMWNNRRTNGWIALEMVVVAYFMWGVIDPVYVLMSNRAIPDGFDVEKVYVMALGGNSAATRIQDLSYSETEQKVLEDNENAVRIMRFIREQCPEIESSALIIDDEHPAPRSDYMQSVKLQADTIQGDVSLYSLSAYSGDEMFNVFRVNDISTGKPLTPLTDDKSIYISEDAARHFFPDATEYVGKMLAGFVTIGVDSVRIAGVFRPMKLKAPTLQPMPTAYVMKDMGTIYGTIYSKTYIAFRLRDDASAAAFEAKFKQEIVPQLPLGYFKYGGMTNLSKTWAGKEVTSGATNKLRLHAGMTLFFLLCVFLGVSGTFWLRAKSRRGEIGLRKALGGSSARILTEFMTEAWLLTTISWLVGILIVYNRVIVTGFAEPPEFETTLYVQNRFKPHFWIVSGLVYGLMLLIAFVGTWIPARQAASIDASEALREDN